MGPVRSRLPPTAPLTYKFPAASKMANAVSGMVLRVNPGGTLSRVVGNGQPCTGGPANTQFVFDGMPASDAQLCGVRSIMIDKDGVMYLPYGSQILRVTTDGIIHTVAGNALATAIGDGARLSMPALTPVTRERERSTRMGTW